MIKLDELQLFHLLKLHYNDHAFATDISKQFLNMDDKRALYILNKWTTCGIWECGMTLRSGWFNDPKQVRNVQVYDELMRYHASCEDDKVC